VRLNAFYYPAIENMLAVMSLRAQVSCKSLRQLIVNQELHIRRTM